MNSQSGLGTAMLQKYSEKQEMDYSQNRVLVTMVSKALGMVGHRNYSSDIIRNFSDIIRKAVVRNPRKF